MKPGFPLHGPEPCRGAIFLAGCGFGFILPLSLRLSALLSVPLHKETNAMDELVGKLAARLEATGHTLATAESCTGGRVAAAITAWPGCSSFYKGGVVAYSNEVKMGLLHVRPDTLEAFGAVSAQTVCEMALGAMSAVGADCAVATSGIAGPGGGTPGKPVGTVWMAAAVRGEEPLVFCQTGDAGREANASRAAKRVLELLLQALESRK